MTLKFLSFQPRPAKVRRLDDGSILIRQMRNPDYWIVVALHGVLGAVVAAFWFVLSMTYMRGSGPWWEHALLSLGLGAMFPVFSAIMFAWMCRAVVLLILDPSRRTVEIVRPRPGSVDWETLGIAIVPIEVSLGPGLNLRWVFWRGVGCYVSWRDGLTPLAFGTNPNELRENMRRLPDSMTRLPASSCRPIRLGRRNRDAWMDPQGSLVMDDSCRKDTLEGAIGRAWSDLEVGGSS